MKNTLRTMFRSLAMLGLCAAFWSLEMEPARAAGLESAAHRAIYGKPAAAYAAIRQLRAAGRAGLKALEEEAGRRPIPGSLERRRNAAFDGVGAQHDNAHSLLFWHTDFDSALAAARSEGKPILSLRLLGRLDEEYSCANSRFFRTALYANAEVSKVLRERFVLHWKTVRPVPLVTIDFGDGRRIRRTLTGNSIHYILDAKGRPVDALPGLYGPRAFLVALEKAGQLALQTVSNSDRKWEAALRNYHRAQLSSLLLAWQADVRRLGVPQNVFPISAVGAAIEPSRRVFAANVIAPTKFAVEKPLLLGIVPDVKILELQTDESLWARIADLHADDARLDAGSLKLLYHKLQPAEPASPAGVVLRATELTAERTVRDFERSMALDTVRNQYLLHRQIHEWLSKGEGGKDVEALNERVYEELFLTSSSDPWLGLAPEGTYTALDDNGLAVGRGSVIR